MDADDVLLGLELGVIGGVFMLAWSAMVCPVTGRAWWLIPNLFASHFYTTREVYDGPGVVTVVGIAMQLFTSGVVGVVNGVLTPGGRLSGLGIAVIWYLLCFLFLWKRIAPLMVVQAVQPILWTGYFVFGSTLGWHSRFRARRATLAA